jgi:hypothetical protein
MAIELATAYVSLTTSARGIGASVSRDLAGVGDAAEQAGDEGGRRMGGRLARGTEAATGKIKGMFGNVAAAAGGMFAGMQVVEFFGSSISAASDLQETVSKSGVIFGTQAGEINKWASGAASTMGLSKQAALDAAAGFGDMFSQIGIAGGEAAKMSTSVVQMAADLGSFNNLPTAEVADMMSGAFRGEFDSLQRVIPNINAARVEQEALSLSHKKSAKELTAAEKAQAVMNIVQKDGARAAGDFARTSDGLANSQKTLSAKMDDAKAKIGQGLMPVMAALTQFAANTLVPALAAVAGFIQRNISWLGPLAAIIGTIVAAWALYVGVTKAWAAITKIATAVQMAFNVVMALNPVMLVVLAIVALIAILVLAYNKVSWFRNAVNVAFAFIKNAVGVAIRAIVAAFNALKNAITVVKNWIVARFNDLVAFVRGLPGKISGAVSGMWNGIKDGVSTAYNWVKDKLGDLVSVVSGLPGKIGGFLRGLWAPVYDALRPVLNNVSSLWNRTIGSLKFTIPKWVPGLGGKSWSVPKMPSFAAGGQLQPGWNLVGEGGAELVHKAGSSARVFSAGQTAAMTRAAPSAAPPINVTVPLYLDKRVLAEAVFTVGGRDYAAGRRA